MGIVSLNGSESELKGGVLEVDVWFQKPKTERAEKAPKQAWKQPVGEAGEKVAPLQAERGRQRAKLPRSRARALRVLRARLAREMTR